MLKTAAASSLEVSRTTKVYVPYPRLRVSVTSAQVQSSAAFAIRRCIAPLESSHALSEAYLLPPPRALGASRILHSYPLKKIVLLTEAPEPLALATATTPRPGIGSESITPSGWYPGSTRIAAYSVPTCVELTQVESALTVVIGSFSSGCTSHFPVLTYKMRCWFGCAPCTRPWMMSSLSGPPSAAGGTLVNSMVGPSLLFWEWHPWTAKLQPKIISMNVHASFFRGTLAKPSAAPRRA